MATPRLAVEAPDIAPSVGGILSVANIIPSQARVAMGVNYATDGTCGQASPVPEGCFNEGPEMPEDGKTFDGFADIDAASFGVYKGITCWLDGSDDYTATARLALERGESFAIASALRSSILDVSPTIILPDTNAPVIALAAAEQYASEHYNGVPTIHVTRYGATILASLGLIKRNDLTNELTTFLGSKVSADAGYIANETTAFNIWVTGQVNLWQSPVVVTQGNNLNFNEGTALAERLYAATVECFHGKVVATAPVGD